MVRASVILSRLALHMTESCVPVADEHVRAIVRACSPIADDQERALAWAEYLARVWVELDVEAARVPPCEVLDEDELAGPDCAETARQVARQRSADALDVLTGRLP
jgi:hypothetical protein